MATATFIARTLRVLVGLAAFVVFVAVVAVAGALVYVTTESGERLVHGLAVRGSAAGGLGTLAVEGLEIDFPLTLRAHRLVFTVDERVWLEVDGLRFRLGLAALTAGNLRFSHVYADAVVLGELPQFRKAENEISWPRALVFDGLDVSRVLLDGAYLGLAPEPVGPFAVRADGVFRPASGSFRIDGLAAFGSLDGALRDGSVWEAGPGTLLLNLVRRDRALRGTATLGADRVGVGEVGVDAATVRVQMDPIDGFGREIKLQATATPSGLPEAVAFAFGQRVEASVDMRLADVDSPSARALRAADGSPVRTMALRLDGGAGVRLRLDAEEDPFADGRTTGRLSIEGSELAWPEPNRRVLEILGDRFSLGAEFEVMEDGTPAAHDVELAFGPLDAHGDLRFAPGNSGIDATISGSFSDLSLLTEYLGRATSGSADYRVVVGGTKEALELAVSVSTTELVIEDTQLSRVDAVVDLTGLPAGPVGARITGRLGNDRVTLDANARVTMDDNGVADVTAALSDGVDNHLKVSGKLAGGGALPKGRLDADLGDLADLSALVGIDIAGRVAADLVSDERGLSGSADAAGLLLPGGVQVEALTIRTPPGVRDRVEVEALGIHYAAAELDSVSAAVRRKADAWGARLVLHDTHGAIDLVADFEVREGEVTEATMTHLSGTAAGQDLTLHEPFFMRSQRDGPTRVTGELRIGEGRLRVDWSIEADASFGHIKADRFPLRYITPVFDETLWLDGNVAADIVVPRRYASGDETKPVINVTVRGARSADKAAAGKFVGFRLDARAEQRGQDVAFKAVLGGGDLDQVTLEGTVDGASGGAPFAAVGPDSALRATVDGGLGPGAVAELAALFDTRLFGTLTTDLSLAGSLGDPTLQGLIAFDDGRFEDAATGAILEDIHARLQGDSADAARLTISASDGERGRLSGKGRLDLSGGLGSPRLEVNLSLSGFRATRLDAVTGRTSGELDLRAARDDLSIAGELRTDELSVALPKRLPSQVVALEVIEENEQFLDRVYEPVVAVSSGPIADLALVVEVPGPAFVRSKEVKSEWRGRIEVGGTTAAPTVGGGLELIRGDFAVLGLRVVATAGKLRFDPSPDARHSLDIRGQIRRSGIVVTVIIAGELSQLSVRLESEPPLPEDEILAFLLFGSSASSLTPVEAVQLAAAVASLANPRTAADPLAWVRDTTKLDRVDIVSKEVEDESQYMLSAGKYVREGVFLSVEQPLGEGASEVSIELEVTDRLTLKSSVGADSTGSVGAAWTHDY